jgi:hypothetical protein
MASTPSDTTSNELAYRHREGECCLNMLCSVGCFVFCSTMLRHSCVVDHGWGWRKAKEANDKIREALKVISTLSEDSCNETDKAHWAIEQALDVIAAAFDNAERKHAKLEKDVKEAMDRLDKGARVLVQTKEAMIAVIRVLTPEQIAQVSAHLVTLDNSSSF